MFKCGARALDTSKPMESLDVNEVNTETAHKPVQRRSVICSLRLVSNIAHGTCYDKEALGYLLG